ncbi:MAG TPA: glycosyltransferase [Puia sp.]|jgi:glycosyltransferase involved in cell wall biosynthesis|nr:glycosyltransferase [Puia sp.]
MFDFFVLIPCYNDLSGLRTSIASIRYDPTRYAVLVVDDGSMEPVIPEQIKPYNPQGSPVFIIRLPHNTGITSALNTGLAWLEERRDFRFVARLDCGDCCAPQRFTRQVSFLDSHPHIDLVGSWVRFRDVANTVSYPYRTPTGQAAIRKGMHFRNLFIHPALMWRASVSRIIARYPVDLPYAEDYGFVYEILRRGNVAILPEELVTCRIDPQGLSLRFRRQQLKSRLRTVLRYHTNSFLGLLGAMRLALMFLIPYKLALSLKTTFLTKE